MSQNRSGTLNSIIIAVFVPFPPAAALVLDQRLASRIQDYTIFNLTVRYGRSNPHSSMGFLVHPRFGKVVGDWLLRQPK